MRKRSFSGTIFISGESGLACAIGFIWFATSSLHPWKTRYYSSSSFGTLILMSPLVNTSLVVLLPVRV
jgi:hypothetical protein